MRSRIGGAASEQLRVLEEEAHPARESGGSEDLAAAQRIRRDPAAAQRIQLARASSSQLPWDLNGEAHPARGSGGSEEIEPGRAEPLVAPPALAPLGPLAAWRGRPVRVDHERQLRRKRRLDDDLCHRLQRRVAAEPRPDHEGGQRGKPADHLVGLRRGVGASAAPGSGKGRRRGRLAKGGLSREACRGRLVEGGMCAKGGSEAKGTELGAGCERPPRRCFSRASTPRRNPPHTGDAFACAIAKPRACKQPCTMSSGE